MNRSLCTVVIILILLLQGCDKNDAHSLEGSQKALAELQAELYQLGVPKNAEEMREMAYVPDDVNGALILGGEAGVREFKALYDEIKPSATIYPQDIFASQEIRTETRARVKTLGSWIEKYEKSSFSEGYDFKYDWVNPALQEFPEFAAFKILTWQLCHKATLQAYDENSEGAIESLLASYRASVLIRENNNMIGFLVGIACEKISNKVSQQLAMLGCLTSAELETLLSKREDFYEEFGFKNVLINDAYTYQCNFADFKVGSIATSAKVFGFEENELAPDNDLHITRAKMFITKYHVNTIKKFVKNDDVSEAYSMAVIEADNVYEEAKKERNIAAESLTLLPPSLVHRFHIIRDLNRIILQLAIYKLEYGMYPSHLEEFIQINHLDNPLADYEISQVDGGSSLIYKYWEKFVENPKDYEQQEKQYVIPLL